MKLTIPTLRSLEAKGIAAFTGALFLKTSLPDERIAAAEAIDYPARVYLPDPVVVRHASPRRGALLRLAEFSQDRTCLRFRDRMLVASYLPIDLFPSQIMPLEDVLGSFIEDGRPCLFRRPAPSLSQAQGIVLGDFRHNAYSSILFLDERQDQILFFDLDISPPAAVSHRRTSLSLLPAPQAESLRARYRAALDRLQADPLNPRNCSTALALRAS